MTIACYARKSSKKLNDSIEHQLSIINGYISSQKEFSGADILYYLDDGVSGITTDREQFQNLLTGVRKREIDVIVVKDLSRLGRNYLDVCKLVDSILPFMNVRLIAVADNYDSKFKQQTLIDLGTAFKTVLNEFYVMESSEKLQLSARQRIRDGQILGSVPFGYKRIDKYTVVVDEEQAATVRAIFEMSLKGESSLSIAKKLNLQGIRTAKGSKWTYAYVNSILKNKSYIGYKASLTYKRNVKLKIKEPVDENQWYVDENAYPPIISKEIFEKAQSKFNGDIPKENHTAKHMMAGKLICGHCGKTLYRRKNRAGCKNGFETGMQACFKGSVVLDKLYAVVLEKVKEYIKPEIDGYDFKFSFSDIVTVQSEITALKEKKARLYSELYDDKISVEQFKVKNDKLSAEITAMKEKQAACRRSAALKTRHGSERPIDTLYRLYYSNELTNEHMMFVEKIVVYSKDDYTVILSEKSPLSVLCRNMDIYEEENQ